AIRQVASLKQDYQQRIVAAAPSDKERIAAEALGVLTKAVTDQGLTVEEYTSILEVAQNDSGVREKLRQRIVPSEKLEARACAGSTSAPEFLGEKAPKIVPGRAV